ncbi:MAG: carboxypeptidase-like regulatory domain-containing protein [Euryarchaeota archaeon]|nr:carboxypeptidase-like regulatory domain-containing protein [Euryarchaeota archaeon]
MRKIIFSLFLLLFLSGVGSAFQDDVERYPNGTITDYWDILTPQSSLGFIRIENDGNLNGNKIIRMRSQFNYGAYLSIMKSKYVTDINYNSFIIRTDPTASSNTFYICLLNPVDDSVLYTSSKLPLSPSGSSGKVEIIKVGDTSIHVYFNGVLHSIGTLSQSWEYPVKLYIHVYCDSGTINILLDDFTYSSIIGMPTSINEGIDTGWFTWSGQLMRNYPNSDFKITLYSLSNMNNAGAVKTWKIPDQSTFTGNGGENGYITYNRAEVLENNFGLYMLQMTRDGETLTETYFMYNSLANPIGLPETIFMATADVSADIRDYANNGGLINPGDTVYLFANNSTAGCYPIRFDIKNTPYNFEASVRKAYSSETNVNSDITFTGLTNFYNVKLDGTNIGSVNGGTFSYHVDWDNYNEHIFQFSPDLTQPGIYGYTKDLKTNKGTNTAKITVSNNTWSTDIFSDETGFFYITGLSPGETYTISAEKSGFTATKEFTVPTNPDATTRKDLYLDPIDKIDSGEGYYYASHDVIFHVREFWYSDTIPGVQYSVSDQGTAVKTGFTDSEGSFVVSKMNQSTNYTISLTYNGETFTKFIEPGLTEYYLTLREGGELHTYVNPWLTLTYSELDGNVTVHYSSTKPISEANTTVIAGDGTNFYTGTSSDSTHLFSMDLSGGGDYNILFQIEATDGSKASQSWSYSSPGNVKLFPDSYPAWLKNVLFGGLVILFLLSFGKSKNDLACTLTATLCSLGYFFGWIVCSFNFIALIWLIAIGATYLHYKRTGHLG